MKRTGWDGMMQIREEVNFTRGRITVRGKLVTCGKAKRADYILYYKPNIPIGIIEAKDNNHSVGSGMQQPLDYAVTLNIPFVFSSNGDDFIFHDRTGTSMEKEATLSPHAFPSPKGVAERIIRMVPVEIQMFAVPRVVGIGDAACVAVSGVDRLAPVIDVGIGASQISRARGAGQPVHARVVGAGAAAVVVKAARRICKCAEIVVIRVVFLHDDDDVVDFS